MKLLHKIPMFFLKLHEKHNNKLTKFFALRSADAFIFFEKLPLINFIAALVILGLILVMMASVANAVELTDLSVEYKHATGTNRHWTIPQNEEKRGELNLHMRVDGEYLYSKTKVLTKFTSQFRYGALDQEVGVKPSENVEVFLHHISQHAMDWNYGVDYPNENAIGIRIKLNE